MLSYINLYQIDQHDMCLTYESSRCYNVYVNINGSCLPARLEVRSTSGKSTVECIYKKPSSNLSVIINALGTVNNSIFYIDGMSKEILQNNMEKSYQHSIWYNGTENIKIFNNNKTYTYLTVETPVDATLRFLEYETTINTPNVFINSTITQNGTILSLQRSDNYKKITQDQFRYISTHRAEHKITDNGIVGINMGSNDIDTFPFILANIHNTNNFNNIRLPQYNLFNIVNIYDFDVNYFNNINRNQVKNTLIQDLNIKNTTNNNDITVIITNSLGFHSSLISFPINKVNPYIYSFDSSKAHEMYNITSIRQEVFKNIASIFRHNPNNLFNQTINNQSLDSNIFASIIQKNTDVVKYAYPYEIQGKIGNCGLISAITSTHIIDDYTNFDALYKNLKYGYFPISIMKKVSKLIDTPRNIPNIITDLNNQNNNKTYIPFSIWKVDNDNYIEEKILLYNPQYLKNITNTIQTGNIESAIKYIVINTKKYLSSKQFGVFIEENNKNSYIDYTNLEKYTDDDIRTFIIENNPFYIGGITYKLNKNKTIVETDQDINIDDLYNFTKIVENKKIVLDMAQYYSNIHRKKSNNTKLFISQKQNINKNNIKTYDCYTYNFKKDSSLIEEYCFYKATKQHPLHKFINITKLKEVIKPNIIDVDNHDEL